MDTSIERLLTATPEQERAGEALVTYQRVWEETRTRIGQPQAQIRDLLLAFEPLRMRFWLMLPTLSWRPRETADLRDAAPLIDAIFALGLCMPSSADTDPRTPRIHQDPRRAMDHLGTILRLWSLLDLEHERQHVYLALKKMKENNFFDLDVFEKTMKKTQEPNMISYEYYLLKELNTKGHNILL